MITFTIRIGTVNPLNRREHHMARARRVQAERSATSGSALVALRGDGLMALRKMPKPIVVTLTRVGVRLMDSDGVPAALKGVRDEVGVLLGTGDAPSAPVEWRYRQERGERPCVRVEVRSAQEAAA